VRIAYFDCPAGVSGEMILGALLDAGLPLDALRAELASLNYTIGVKAEPVKLGEIRAMQVSVSADNYAVSLDDIVARLGDASIPGSVASKVGEILRRWGRVEAKIRGLVEGTAYPPSSMAGIAEVVGVVAGLHRLGVDQVAVSPLPIGYGSPAASPAVAAMAAGFPLRGVDAQADLMTPSGAAILTTLAVEAGPLPTMTLERVAYGAGQQELPFPDIIRLWLGHAEGQGLQVRTLLVIETNIDDMNPEFYDHVMGQLFRAGALDVTLHPMQMKKNRPATLLRVLCAPGKLGVVRDILLRETTTLGVRVQEIRRFALSRRGITVQTPWGTVRVKVADLPNGLIRAIPEYDDCRRLSEAANVPLWEVYRVAQARASKSTQDREE